jgi:hypothetical protein
MTNEHKMKAMCRDKVKRIAVETFGHVFYARAYGQPSYEEHAKRLTAGGRSPTLAEIHASAEEEARRPLASVQGRDIEQALDALKARLAEIA